MPPRLSKRLVIHSRLLHRLVATRLAEAEMLLGAQMYSSAVYLGGYAVECQLKATVCKTLRLDELPETFKTHDLDLLLLHSGVHVRLNSNIAVADSFKRICGMWKTEMELRYSDPENIKEKDARLFMDWVAGTEVGVVPWLRATD